LRGWFFLAGYVMIRIEGLSLERFLNLAAQENLRVYNVRRSAYTTLHATLSFSGFRGLNKLAHGRYQIVVARSGGLPFLWRRLWKRPALLAGLGVLVLAVIAASLFVWDVRVCGLNDAQSREMLAELERLGLHTGAYKGGIDADALETQLIISHDEIAWLDLRIRGVVAELEAVPALPVPKIVDENTPCSIVAAKDAYIETITPLSGEARVQPGHTVQKGDVLISGLIWDEGTRRMLVAARGEVMGSVWYTATVRAPLFEQTREPTGDKQIVREIAIGSDVVRVGGACRFAEYDTRLGGGYTLGGQLFVPVRVSIYECSEVELKQSPAELMRLKTQIEEQAFFAAQAKLRGEAEIAGHRAWYEVDGQTLVVKVYVQTLEDIGAIQYLEE